MINSTNEIVNICKSIDSPTHMVFLVVESLFTNVPVDDTIEIIHAPRLQQHNIIKTKYPKDNHETTPQDMRYRISFL